MLKIGLAWKRNAFKKTVPGLDMVSNIHRSTQEKTSVIIFLKAPIKGFVKTRLACKIGDEAALRIYRRFVVNTLEMLAQTGHTVRAYSYPASEKEKAQELLGHHIPLFPQKGNHLGERMKNAINDTFTEGFDKAILIGTDIPDLNSDIINDAVIGLNEYPAVIGPSMDGGYYLIGFNPSGFLPDVFNNMPWGTNEVFSKTTNYFAERNIRIRILTECRDIDTYEDLNEFLFDKKSAANDYHDILAKFLK